jgi:uncharacterized delta-60 repeat protein
VGGAFSSYDEQEIGNGITRLNPDGTLDYTFNTGEGLELSGGFPLISIAIKSFALQNDGKIVAGGSFSSYDGEEIGNGITRLNQDGTLDSTFITGEGFDYGGVTSLALQNDGKIVVGGIFSSYDGEEIGYSIARLIPPMNNVGDDDDDVENGGDEGGSSSHGSSGGGGSSRHRMVSPKPAQIAPASQEDLIKSILEQLILVLQQLIQSLTPKV